MKIYKKFFQKNENLKILKYCLILFISYRLIITFITFLGLGTLPTINHFTGEYFTPSSNLNYFERWGNWDGKIYQSIATIGYNEVHSVFFPLYPLLIKLFSIFGIPIFWSGFLLSQIFTILSLIYLYKLSRLDFDETTSKNSVFFLLIYPTSFYLIALYNESLTLFTLLASFYYSRQKNWFLASVFASLASITRLTGVIALIILFIEFFYEKVFDRLKIIKLPPLKVSFYFRLTTYLFLSNVLLFIFLKFSINTLPLDVLGITQTITDIVFTLFLLLSIGFLIKLIYPFVFKFEISKFFNPNFTFVLLTPIPLLSYLVFLQQKFNDPFIFLKSESIWGKYLSSPWQSPLQSFEFLMINFLVISEYSSRVHLRFLIFLFLLIILYFTFKKLRPTYFIFTFLAIIIPLSSGSLIDLPRYSLIIFPIYLLIANIRNEILKSSLTLLSIALLALLSILFINSYFFM